MLNEEKECGYYSNFTRHVSDSVRSQGYLYFDKKKFFLDKNVIFEVTFSTYTSLNMLVEPSDECVHERDVNVNIRFVALGFGCNGCV